MNREEALRLRPGDTVIIDPLWNRTERHRKFDPGGITVLEVSEGHFSQTGVKIAGRDMHGAVWQLDAGWFSLPPPSTPDLFEARSQKIVEDSDEDCPF